MGIAAASESRVARAFAPLRARGQAGLVPFLPAGYPDLATTQSCLLAAQRAGATVIEVGIPFSDPIADGPVIQQAFAHALQQRIRLADIFAAIGEIRSQLTVPVMAMVTYSIVYRIGLERFAEQAREAGLSGVILPDVPPPEAQDICHRFWESGLDTTLLIAPTTSPQRRGEIADLCSGFIYYLSVSGITGERTALPADLASNLKQIRQLTDKPLAVGFGISTAAHVRQLRGHADAAIVGSAIVRRMRDAAQKNAVISDVVESYCQELAEGGREA